MQRLGVPASALKPVAQDAKQTLNASYAVVTGPASQNVLSHSEHPRK